ncbi:MAG: glycosyltransferase family 4 protein [Candidatus Zixiibacteriota bacterium]|nr:MAG: glycosyltransferase family 4 protein [candidate division Zixibacteria bacterium]
MNILFFDSIDKDIFGGLENWIGMVAAHLVRKGHQVAVAGRPGSQYLRRMAAIDDRIKILPVNISGDFNPITIAGIKRLLNDHDIDVVTVNFNKDIRLAGLAARWRGKTRVLWRVGMNITKNNFVHRNLTPRLIDGVITPSRSLKNQLIESGYIMPDMVHVIPNGTKLKDSGLSIEDARHRLREKYNLPPQSTIAVNSGRFVNHKGHAFLIEAAPTIVAKHPDIVFLFLGDGYLQKKHQQRISKLNLEKQFVFAGMLDDLQLELMGSDLMVHPSIIEPFGISLIEGMQAGLPIIASAVGGIPEVVGKTECAVLVDPGNVDQLATAVNSVLDSPGRMRQMGQAAQKRWREEFTIDIMLGRVEQYLTQFMYAENR